VNINKKGVKNNQNIVRTEKQDFGIIFNLKKETFENNRKTMGKIIMAFNLSYSFFSFFNKQHMNESSKK
jgi:hypothetical protein